MYICAQAKKGRGEEEGGEGDKRNKERKGRGEKKRAFHANLAQSPGIMRKGGYGGGV